MHAIYRNSHFLLSAPDIRSAPADRGREIAFAGRSNAGKSSAINAITAQRSLARTSKTPGRTQQLVFFEVDEALRLVDLPGYGYAKVPGIIQRRWQRNMEQYFRNRKSLCGIMLIMDIRHPLTEFDQQMIHWCRFCEIPLHIILTKSDKLKFGAQKTTLMQVNRTLDQFNLAVSVQLFSALKKSGIEEAHKKLDTWFGIGFDGRETS